MYETFRKLLDTKGIKAADFSRATGISEATISTWKKRGVIGSKHMKTVADFFDVPIDYLMTGEMPRDDYEPPRIDNPLILELIHTASGCSDADIKQANEMLKRLKAYSDKLKEFDNVRPETRG